MFRRSSVPIKALFLIVACALICSIAVDQFPELLLLKDNTSNDFTIRKESIAADALILRAAIHHSIPLNSNAFEDYKWIRRSPTIFEDGRTASADFLVLSVLRR